MEVHPWGGALIYILIIRWFPWRAGDLIPSSPAFHWCISAGFVFITLFFFFWVSGKGVTGTRIRSRLRVTGTQSTTESTRHFQWRKPECITSGGFCILVVVKRFIHDGPGPCKRWGLLYLFIYENWNNEAKNHWKRMKAFGAFTGA